MNKQLIKTYFKEFEHWLNGGKLQAKFVNDPWEEAPEDIFSYNAVNFVLVIDDEYVEFRKALAEGKAIQMYCKYDGVPPIWDDMTEVIKSIGFVMTKDNYRIKPEESKFKKGDWVRDKVNGKVVQLTEHFHPGGIELWKPKNKEYFWYKNDLVKFDESQSNAGLLLESVRGCSYHVPANFEKYCEPFIGNLPSNLK